MNYSLLPDGVFSSDLLDFRWIIKELDEADNFDDKEIIFGVYFSLFYAIVLPLSTYDNFTLFEYKSLIHKMMLNVIKMSKGRKDTVSCRSFIANLLYYLNVKNELKISPVNAIIELYREDLDEVIQKERDIVNNFDFVEKEIDFSDKAHIIMCFKEYLSCLYARISNLYGNVDTTNLRDYITNSLCLNLSEIIEKSSDLVSFNSLLKEHTKNELKYVMNCGEFDFLILDNEFTRELIKELDDCELSVFRLYLLYKIAGYDFNDISGDKIDNVVFAKELGIDSDTCNKTLLRMSKKTNKFRIKMFFGLSKTKKKKKN